MIDNMIFRRPLVYGIVLHTRLYVTAIHGMIPIALLGQPVV